MNILAFDTCFGACSAAVADCSGDTCHVRAREDATMTRGHAEALIPMIERVLQNAGLQPGEIDRIAVTTGPGTFAGVRVAIAAARAMSLATDARCVGVGTLEAMAATAVAVHNLADGTLALVHDARRDQVYLQSFHVSAGTVTPQMTDPVLCAPEAVPQTLPTPATMAIGSGAAGVEWRTGDPPVLATENIQVAAASVALLAAARPPVDGALSPVYLRPPDAKPQTGFALERCS